MRQELAAREVEDFASSVRGRVLHGDDVAGADRNVEQLCPEGALGQPEEFEDEGVADGGPARMVSGDGGRAGQVPLRVRSEARGSSVHVAGGDRRIAPGDHLDVTHGCSPA